MRLTDDRTNARSYSADRSVDGMNCGAPNLVRDCSAPFTVAEAGVGGGLTELAGHRGLAALRAAPAPFAVNPAIIAARSAESLIAAR